MSAGLHWWQGIVSMEYHKDLFWVLFSSSYLSRICHFILQCRGGIPSTPPPLPYPSYHGGGMTLRVRPRVQCVFSSQYSLTFALIYLRIEVRLWTTITLMIRSRFSYLASKLHYSARKSKLKQKNKQKFFLSSLITEALCSLPLSSYVLVISFLLFFVFILLIVFCFGIVLKWFIRFLYSPSVLSQQLIYM